MSRAKPSRKARRSEGETLDPASLKTKNNMNEVNKKPIDLLSKLAVNVSIISSAVRPTTFNWKELK